MALETLFTRLRDNSLDGALAVIASTSKLRVGPVTLKSGDHAVGEPAALATIAGVSLDVYSLGRLGASEWAGGPAAALVAQAECARNEAKRRGVCITCLLTKDSDAADSGFYGRQSGRWASTWADPTQRTIAAGYVAAELGSEVAGGAVGFFHPKAQDSGMQAGRALLHDAIDIVTRWAKGGRVFAADAPLYTRYGIDPYRFMVFRQGKSAADPSEAIAAIERGRGGLPPGSSGMPGLLALVAGGLAIGGFLA